jgi:hypothetical protein
LASRRYLSTIASLASTLCCPLDCRDVGVAALDRHQVCADDLGDQLLLRSRQVQVSEDALNEPDW